MNHVIILAAGQGQRMEMSQDKMLAEIHGKPLIYYSLMAFNDHPEIDTITVVTNKNNKEKIRTAAETYHFPKIKKFTSGGVGRQNSVEKGLLAVEKFGPKPDDIILVHNGANPLPSHEEISETIEQVRETGACIVGHFIASTVKEVDDRHIIKTSDRKKLFAAETPQAATFKVFKKALNNAQKQKLEVTDEAMMMEAIGQKVSFVKAHENNFKITTQADFAKLKTILGDFPEDFRVGLGQDSHMFDEKKKGLVLAGVQVKNEFKLKANSDGDVILHAVFNAISQAIGDMSLGFYADAQHKKGINDSRKYLEKLLGKMKKQKYKLNSLGVMLEGAKPKIDPLVSQMKGSLTKILGLKPERIGITATTGEECSVFGDGLGVQCFAIISLIKESK